MLERVDRLQLVVKDRQAAARIFGEVPGAQPVRETRGAASATERDGLWVHPSALCGLLLGVSRTTVGWEWWGQPARVAGA